MLRERCHKKIIKSGGFDENRGRGSRKISKNPLFYIFNVPFSVQKSDGQKPKHTKIIIYWPHFDKFGATLGSTGVTWGHLESSGSPPPPKKIKKILINFLNTPGKKNVHPLFEGGRRG